MGRPKKENAIKAGQLQDGLSRYTIIVETDLVNQFKAAVKERRLHAKDEISRLLKDYIEKVERKKRKKAWLNEIKTTE